MKRVGNLAACLLLSAAILLFTLVIAAPSFTAYGDGGAIDAKLVPIERIVSQGRVNRTPYFAYIGVKSGDVADIWVPAELLSDMKCPVKLSPDKSYFTGRIENPSEKLGLPVLQTLLPNKAPTIDIDFRAVSDDGKFYFNISGMEPVTGITGTLTDSRRVIVPPKSGDILVVGTPEQMPEKARIRVADFTPPALASPFSLIWEQVADLNPDISTEDALPTVKIVSPTWFALTDADGTVSNKADWTYTIGAHAKGYGVWALVSNGFNRDRTKAFLSKESLQNQFIARMLVYSKLYGFDGINIDFENVGNDDADELTAFVRKLAAAARENGLAVTIDLPVPTTWNKAYDRRALSEAVDYVIVMAYDEHWGSSPRAGSTASLPWTQQGVKRTLNDVPAEKLLMGAPFYTREWAETNTGKGKVSVRARTMAMVSVDARLAETGAALQWQGDKGQNYFQYVSDDKTYKIWVEDERSIALRMSVLNEFRLAGAAFWRKGFEKPEIWPVIERALAGGDELFVHSRMRARQTWKAMRECAC
ncbi:MAG: glycoside hydrolase [Synergistaceae bacterium]|nr:glycoside hydrolase [Synergistaceae bacterium]